MLCDLVLAQQSLLATSGWQERIPTKIAVVQPTESIDLLAGGSRGPAGEDRQPEITWALATPLLRGILESAGIL
jgi:hypothetical protein